MRHSSRLATGAPERRAELQNGSGVREKFGEGDRARERRPELGERTRGGRRARSITYLRARGGIQPRRAPGPRVTYLPTVWLASWRMRLNCFFIVAPLAR